MCTCCNQFVLLRLLTVTTLTRNAPSLETFRFVDVSLLGLSKKWRCKGPSSSAVITCTTSGNTTDSRRDIGICPFIYRPASGKKLKIQVWRKLCWLFLLFRDVEIGDVVTIGECRPLSKTVRFNVLKVTKGSSSKKSFKKF